MQQWPFTYVPTSVTGIFMLPNLLLTNLLHMNIILILHKYAEHQSY